MNPLTLYGSIQNVLFSRVAEETLVPRIGGNLGYSFGLAGIGDAPRQALAGLGEYWSTPDLGAVLPATAPDAPRFAHPGERCYTPFNVHLDGIEAVPLRPVGADALPAAEIWERTFEDLAPGQETALLGGVYFARVLSLRGAFVRRTVTREAAPENGRPISHPENHPHWFGLSPDGGGEGLLAAVVGVALREAAGDSAFEGRERHIFYRHPDAPAEAASLQIHQHALLLEMEESAELPEEDDLARRVGHTLQHGTPLDVKHVLDDSLLTGIQGAFRRYDAIELEGRQE